MWGVTSELRPVLLLRCLAGTFGFFCMMSAPKYLPLGILTVVSRFNIFTTTALSGWWIGEWITCFEVIAMLLSFGGIILIGIAQKQNEQSEESAVSPAQFNLGIALVLGFCIFSSLASVSSRRLKSVNYAVIQFNYALVSSVIMGLTLAFICVKNNEVPFVYESRITYIELLSAAFINMLSQNVDTIANQNANPATLSLFAYVGVFYMFLSDILFFEFTLNMPQLVGVLICLICTMSVIIFKVRTTVQTTKVSS